MQVWDDKEVQQTESLLTKEEDQMGGNLAHPWNHQDQSETSIVLAQSVVAYSFFTQDKPTSFNMHIDKASSKFHELSHIDTHRC